LTVLVLYHAVRRLSGPAAALVATVVLAASPATVTLDRGNVPDTLMILLLVLAADVTITAVLTNRWRSVVLAGVLVALAFQAKMLEAWLVVPALGLAYLVAGRGDLWARLVRIVVLSVTSLVLSFSFMIFVTLTPASQRPYVDGSTDNSIFQQVFTYNGFSRVNNASPDYVVEKTLNTQIFGAVQPAPKVDRLLTSYYGRDTGWLLPAAAVSFVGILWSRRRRPRTDLPRAGAVLWGTWLAVLAVSFTFSTTMNSYYAGALSPAVAALLGIAGVLAWEHRRQPVVALVTAGTALVTAAYAARLLPSKGAGLPPWLAPLAILLGVAAAVVLGWSAWRDWQQGRRAMPRSATGPARSRPAVWGCGLAAAAILLVPAVASASVVIVRLGPFDTPFEPSSFTAITKTLFAPQPSPPGLVALESARRGSPYLMAAQTSVVAAPYIYATGEEVVPLGGFEGIFPTPSASATRAMIANGDFHTALVATPGSSPGAAVIHQLCARVRPRPGTTLTMPSLKIYYCLPAGR
ncbi:MAG TPA: glycosyltransferase family 39 protein, partial [Acidimicrobiales bacterium]|nr:glycosyltransferase family 39 protein [Acidimicrobiales bacterium]